MGALFELLNLQSAHVTRDEPGRSFAEVIGRKQESVMETFNEVKDAFWAQQRRQRSIRGGDSEAGTRSVGSRSAGGDRTPSGPGAGRVSFDSGLQELEALQ